jgi:hypothetical protein
MCGRFLNNLPAAEVVRFFGIRNALPNYPARFNIAPTNSVLIVRLNPKTAERTLDTPLGSRTALGQRPQVGRQEYQRRRRDGGNHARLPRCLRGAAQHRVPGEDPNTLLRVRAILEAASRWRAPSNGQARRII